MLFLGSPALSNIVLCLGDDGHLEWEYSVDGKCGKDGEASHSTDHPISEAEDHCGPCTDVSFIAQDVGCFRLAQSWDAPQFHFTAQYSVRVFSYLDQATPGLFAQPPPLENQHLAHLRTIRLLV
jgi:hypothetical protein